MRLELRAAAGLLRAPARDGVVAGPKLTRALERAVDGSDRSPGGGAAQAEASAMGARASALRGPPAGEHRAVRVSLRQGCGGPPHAVSAAMSVTHHRRVLAGFPPPRPTAKCRAPKTHRRPAATRQYRAPRDPKRRTPATRASRASSVGIPRVRACRGRACRSRRRRRSGARARRHAGGGRSDRLRARARRCKAHW